MRGLRSTLALIIVLVGLGAYIYFVTWKRPENADTPKKDKVFNVASDKIDEIIGAELSVVMGWTPPRRHRCAKVAL